MGLILSTAAVLDSNGNEWLMQTATASAVNAVNLANAATGTNPSITATGTDTNVGLNLVPKGTGSVQIGGQDIALAGAFSTSGAFALELVTTAATTATLPAGTVTLAGLSTAQTFTALNTFGAGTMAVTSPKVTTNILDANGNAIITFSPTASAVDTITITNAATGNPATVEISATGSDTNISLNLVSKGTGTVQVNGVPMAGQTVNAAANASETELTVTTAVVVATYTPTAGGNFIVGGSLRVVTAATTATVVIGWDDAAGTAHTETLLNAVSLPVGVTSLQPTWINAGTAAAITITVTAGTTNQIYASGSIIAIT